MADRQEREVMEKSYAPSSDIYQDNGKVVLVMEMPGVTGENLDIRVDGDRLLINGKKTVTPPQGEYKVREIREGNYHHEFTIDDTIDRGKIEANIKNGVVTVTLGIKEAEKPRKINIAIK